MHKNSAQKMQSDGDYNKYRKHSTREIEREIESLSIFSEQYQPKHVDICRINPCLNSIITSDALFSSTFTSPCTSSFFGDSIGMESCVDVLADEDFHLLITPNPRPPMPPVLGRDRRSTSSPLPPPIPSLARTENLAPRMPWTLRRDYTSDGRLVLTEEPADRHEYFRADRSNGRLTLHLIDATRPLSHADDDVDDDDDDDDEEEQQEEEKEVVVSDETRAAMDGGDSAMKRVEVRRIISGPRCVEIGIGLPAAMRPVHS